MSSFGRRDSLCKQASLDRQQLEGLRRQNTLRQRRQLEKSLSGRSLLPLLNDDGITLLNSLNEDKSIELSVILNSVRESREALANILQRFLSVGISIEHVETRADLNEPGELESITRIWTTRPQLLEALSRLAIERPLSRIVVIPETSNEIWVPTHISDLDKCAHVVVKYEPTEDPKHPGFGDSAYIQRRAQLNAIANSFRYGDPIPFVEYTANEHWTWKEAYSKLKDLRESHCCREYRENIRQMETDGIISAEKIPQLRTLSEYIQRRTGFQLRPCGGLLSARDFLASLAFRTFQATLYVRHSSKPNHCPEPDVIHEILGHCPMFVDPNMAQMSQEIGLLSLGASDEQIEKLSTVYWFIIEFGLCRQDGGFRAIGAGLISAYGELQHACSNVPDHEDFEPQIAAVRPYEDSDYQPVYFVAESIFNAMQKLREYAKEISTSRRYDFDPLTRTVSQKTKAEIIRSEAEQLISRSVNIRDLIVERKNVN